MSWRPENWKNFEDNEFTPSQLNSRAGIFEAGADFMLEAVCAEIEQKENDHTGRYWEGAEWMKQEILNLFKEVKKINK